FFRDVLFQSLQLTITQDGCLPVRIASIERHPNAVSAPVVVATLQAREDRDYRGEVAAVDENGRVIERLSGYVSHIIENHPEYPTPEQIAEPAQRDTERVRQELASRSQAIGVAAPEVSLAYLSGLHALPRDERHEREIPLIRNTVARVLKDATSPRPAWLESGKPVLEGMDENSVGISLSHDDRLCLCAAGGGPQGCDIAPVSPRSREDWLALIGASREKLLQQIVDGGDSLDRAGTRLWAALEAAHKAAGTADLELAVAKHTQDNVLFEATAGGFRVLTFPVTLTRGPERILAVVVPAAPSTAAQQIHYDASAYKAGFEDGPGGRPMFVCRFPITFRETATPSRRLHFSHYFNWVGKVRELLVHPIYDQLVESFSSGQWGMVTNNAETRIVGEATSGDVIEARLWLDRVTGKAESTFDFVYEWWKLTAGDGRKLIATSRMATTWVAVRGHGEIEVRTLPDFGKEFLSKLLPATAAPLAQNDAAPPTELGRELYCE
ncbi:MAG: hypothetical protein FJ388_22175, partial [Verrucomicrobia bacterium]|nr:hypothetical protein [Verrucomicrobiota bacterium]